MGKGRRVSILTEKEMEKLSTPRLLAYRKRLLNIKVSDVDFYTDYDKWYEDCKICLKVSKEILDTREHVVKK